MSNYTIENLIPAAAASGRIPAIKVGTKVFPMLSGGTDVTLGVVNSEGKFQAFSFNGTTPTDSGTPETVTNYKTWNSTLPAPQPSGGAMDFYKCASVDASNRTWSGYKLEKQQNGGYSIKSDSLIRGLEYISIVPTVNFIYSADALLSLGYFYPAEALALLDSNTRFLLMGSLSDLSSNSVQIDNYGLTVQDGLIYGSTSSGYATIPANSLPSDVFVPSHDWTFEICFWAPDSSISIPDIGTTIFGNGQSTYRFDVIIDSSKKVYIGSVLENAGTINRNAYNTFIFQQSALGARRWELNGNQAGTNVNAVGDVRQYVQPIMADAPGGGSRYGYPFKIKYIRISNCLRLV